MIQHAPPWIPDEVFHSKFSERSSVDVAIVGAGITGVTAAYWLRNRGLSIVVLDKDEVGRGDTHLSSAHLTEILDERYYRLIETFGLAAAREIVESKRWAMGAIERIVFEEAIACRFARVPGYLYANSGDQCEELKREHAALQHLSKDSRFVEYVPLPFPTQGGIEVPRQAQFDPYAYVTSLALRSAQSGVQFFRDSQLLSVEEGEPCRLIFREGELFAKKVLLATHAPTLNRLFLVTKVAAYRTYVLGIRAPRLDGLYWDLDEPYHYIRSTHPSEAIVLVGGADHKTGTEDSRGAADAMKNFVRNQFSDPPLLHEWSGQVFNSIDGLPFIGPPSKSAHIYVASGFGGNGMTFGTVGARLFVDWFEEKPNRWADLYRATRAEPIASLFPFLAENKDFPYYFLKDRLGSLPHVESIGVDEGAVVDNHGEKLAVYRDAQGELHALSPRCPHMGCHVHWNRLEKSWDCPCHGSRFDCRGNLLNGPATENLEQRGLIRRKETG